jgi:hypothetical protein
LQATPDPAGGHDGAVERVALAAALVAVALVAAAILQRRRPDAPARSGYAVPGQLDRADFAGPAAPWLVAVFTSATCDACADTVTRARALASPTLAVNEVELAARPDLHRRYAIEAVPLLVLADAEGVVRASFVGPTSATELWAAVAEVRDGPAPLGGDSGGSGTAEVHDPPPEG